MSPGLRVSWLLLSAVLATAMPGRSAGDNLRLGWTAWSDAEIVSRLAAVLIERHTPHHVERVLADIGIQYAGVASGDLDFMLMSWQPETHRDYLEKFDRQLEDLGILYDAAKLGWAVPAYLPEQAIGSIADLDKPRVAARLGWRIQGVDPGAGLTRLSEAALDAYGLDAYQLQYASGAGMAVALRRSIDRNRWIVVTAWRPHWIFGKHDLRFLEDPKGALGGSESVHAIARPGFRRDHPDVARLLSKMRLSLDELEAMMLAGEQDGYAAAVHRFIDANGPRIRLWVKSD